MTSSVSGVDTYDYNDIYELTSVTGSQTHSYAYDGVGNRATADGTAYTVNTLNQYDAVGAQVITYNTNGNLTNDGVNTYTYDEENRLATVDNTSHSASYTYDPFHRRITKTVDGVTVYFVYDGIDVVAEYDASGDLASEYTYSNAIDEVLTMDRGGNTYYYHYDGTGSVTEITDASGSVQESYRYDVYGQPSIFDTAGAPLTTSAIGNRYMYTGREWDAETEIYYYRARMYDPVLGRFLQRDPVGYQDSLNLYQYAGNSPTNAFDPMGGRIKWNWGGAWAAIRNNALGFAITAIGLMILPKAAVAAFMGSAGMKILALAASAGLAWEAQEVLNRFCSKKLYDDPLTTEMIVNVFIGLGSIGLSLLKAAKAGGIANTVDSGESMVLGKSGDYTRLADQLGAKKFSVPKDVWNNMSVAERQAANFRSIDRSINRGDSFIFSNNPSEAYLGSGFYNEIQYLKSRGINVDAIPVIKPW
jgi:RHS repeat-associated protein